VPPQGRWRISGLGLPDAVLKKVYHDNAARLLHLEA
jgi:predicted TIM-barrel fold metal-dependent hydrolase